MNISMKYVFCIVSMFSCYLGFSQYPVNDSCVSFSLSIENRRGTTDTMRLLYYNCEKIYANHDTVILKNGKGFVSGKINRATEAVLFINRNNRLLDGPGVIRFILEPGKMLLIFTKTNNTATDILIEGSMAQKEKAQWEEKNSKFFEEGEVIDIKLLQSFTKDSIHIKDLPSYRSHYIKLSKGITQNIVDDAVKYIKENPGSYLSGYLLRRYIWKIPLDSVKNYYISLSHSVKYSEFGKQILAEVFNQTDDAIFRKENSTPEFFNQLSKIKSLHDISLPDETGKVISLSKFRGKYVLIDFWGSWCRSCIENVPYLEKLKEKMKNDPIEFVSISLDEDVNIWKNAILRHNYPGLNLIDSTELAGTFYKIPWVPVYVVINPDGSMANANAPQPDSGQLEALLYSIMHKNR